MRSGLCVLKNFDGSKYLITTAWCAYLGAAVVRTSHARPSFNAVTSVRSPTCSFNDANVGVVTPQDRLQAISFETQSPYIHLLPSKKSGRLAEYLVGDYHKGYCASGRTPCLSLTLLELGIVIDFNRDGSGSPNLVQSREGCCERTDDRPIPTRMIEASMAVVG